MNRSDHWITEEESWTGFRNPHPEDHCIVPEIHFATCDMVALHTLGYITMVISHTLGGTNAPAFIYKPKL